MGWSLDRLEPSDVESLDRHFLSVGKALYLATAFEQKCRYLARLWKIIASLDEIGDASIALTLGRELRLRQLGRTIEQLASVPFVSENDIESLSRAKDARNYIAHEAANLGSLHAPRCALDQHHAKLHAEVLNLIPGDNLVSSWVYEIEEKEPAPSEIKASYRRRVEAWVFGDTG